jgi:hypothetical protein
MPTITGATSRSHCLPRVPQPRAFASPVEALAAKPRAPPSLLSSTSLSCKCFHALVFQASVLSEAFARFTKVIISHCANEMYPAAACTACLCPKTSHTHHRVGGGSKPHYRRRPAGFWSTFTLSKETWSTDMRAQFQLGQRWEPLFIYIWYVLQLPCLTYPTSDSSAHPDYR